MKLTLSLLILIYIESYRRLRKTKDSARSDFEDVQFLGLSSVDKASTTTTTILREARWRIELLGLTNFQLYWLDWLEEEASRIEWSALLCLNVTRD